MFSTQLDSLSPFVDIFDIILSITIEFVKPKIGISDKGIKAFVANNFIVDQMVQFLFDRVEERRKSWLSVFSSIPYCVQIWIFHNGFKTILCTNMNFQQWFQNHTLYKYGFSTMVSKPHCVQIWIFHNGFKTILCTNMNFPRWFQNHTVYKYEFSTIVSKP